MNNSQYYPLQDWTPDSPNYRSEGAITIQNALPTKASPNYESQPSIALSAIGNINGGNYIVNAVNYDSGHLNNASVTGLSNTKQGTISFWFRNDGTNPLAYIEVNNGNGITVKLNSSNQLQIVGANSGLSTILDMHTTAVFGVSSTWYNCLASWDLNAGTLNLYINNSSDKTVITNTNDILAYSGGTVIAFQNKCAIAEIWFDNSYLDLSNATNRAKFIDASGFPVNLGSSGQTPTGSSPKIYMKSAASVAGTNSGTGGDFTVTGTLAIASSSPSDGTPSQMLGAISSIDTSDVTHIYVGTANKLSELTATTANNLSKSGGYTCNTYWKFASLNNTVYATDFTDNVQSMTIGGTVFADLAGTPPKAQCIGQWGQFIVLGHTSGGTYGGSTSGVVPNRIWGCAIGNPASWPDPLTNAGQAAQAFVQDLPAVYGDLVHLTSGTFMNLAFQQTGITRALYQGAPTVFSFDDYEKKIGLYCPNSVVHIEGNRWAFISSSGFYETDGYSVENIGHNLVNRTFLADLNTSYLSHVRGAFDPVTKLIKWVYPSVMMTLQGGFVVCDKMICYNYIDKRWGIGMINQSIDMIFPSLTLAYTMEQLDSVNSNLDLITPSLDDPSWNGGVPTVGVFGIQQIGSTGSYASYSGSFSGTALTATLDTKIVNPNPGGRAFSNEFKPIVIGVDLTQLQGYVGTQNLLSDSVTWSAASTPETRTGKCSVRSNSVYKRYRMVIPGGFTNALGFEVEEKPGGFA